MKAELKKERRSRVYNQDGLLPEDRDVQVFSGRRFQSQDAAQIQSNDDRFDPENEANKHQICRDLKAHIAKIAGNFDVPVRTRQEKLLALAKKFATGWPYRNNPRLDSFRVDNVPVLQRLATAAADQLGKREQVALAPSTQVGQMGNQ